VLLYNLAAGAPCPAALPGQGHGGLGYLAAAWEPVERACAELAVTVRSSGEERAA
jgi:hypothetical protein